MADDLIPPQIRNGGTGSPDASGVRAPDYRELQAPTAIRTDIPDSGAASRAAALANAFKDFEGISYDVANKAQTQAGALAGAASGNTGHPQYKQGLARFTAYAQAFNNAATGAYAVQAEAEADASAARLRVEANNDPAAFAAAFTARRDAVLKNAPPMAVPMLNELYNKHLAMGLAAISGDQARELQLQHRSTYEVGIQQQATRVATLQGSENAEDHLRAMDEQVKLTTLINGGVNAGLYSPAVAEAMHVAMARKITEQVVETQVDRELSRPDGDPEALISRFRAAHEANSTNPNEPQVLPEAEFQQLMANMVMKVREQRLMDSDHNSKAKLAEQARFEAGDKDFTFRFLSGTLTMKDLANGVASGDLRPERATSLRQLMEVGPTPKSSPVALAHLLHDPNFLDMSAEEIAAYPGVSNPDKIAAQKEQDKRNASWESTQAQKDARARISLAFKIKPGTPSAALSDEQRNALAEAYVEYTALGNATDPAQRDHLANANADKVIQGIQQKQAAAEVQQLRQYRQDAITRHGPGSDQPWDQKRLDAYLKQKDDAIAAASARAKGQ